MLAYLYWPAAVLLMAVGQGLLLPAIRRTEPGREATRQAIALHYVFVALYYLPIALVPRTWSFAVLARLLLFDPVLNVAAGETAFSVGKTAATDRALRWLAGKLGVEPERLRAGLWVVSVLITALLYTLYGLSQKSLT